MLTNYDDDVIMTEIESHTLTKTFQFSVKSRSGNVKDRGLTNRKEIRRLFLDFSDYLACIPNLRWRPFLRRNNNTILSSDIVV